MSDRSKKLLSVCQQSMRPALVGLSPSAAASMSNSHRSASPSVPRSSVREPPDEVKRMVEEADDNDEDYKFDQIAVPVPQPPTPPRPRPFNSAAPPRPIVQSHPQPLLFSPPKQPQHLTPVKKPLRTSLDSRPQPPASAQVGGRPSSLLTTTTTLGAPAPSKMIAESNGLDFLRSTVRQQQASMARQKVPAPFSSLSVAAASPPQLQPPRPSYQLDSEQRATPSTLMSWGSVHEAQPPLPTTPPPPVGTNRSQRLINESGFKNEGNTCYAASVLTMLLRQRPVQPAIREFIKQYGHYTVTREVQQLIPADDGDEDEAAEARTSGNPPESRGHENDDDFWFLHNEDVVDDRKTKMKTKPQRVKRILVEDSACPLHRALSDAMERFLCEPEGVVGGISMQTIADALRNYTDVFFDRTQHDAHEFYMALMAALEAEALTVMTMDFEKQQQKIARRLERAMKRGDPPLPVDDKPQVASPPTAQQTWVNRLFQGASHSVIACRCVGCGMLQGSHEPFMNISVPLPTSASLAAHPKFPAELNTQERVIASLQSDVLDTYRCDGCRRTSLQYHGSALSHVPPLLVVQWKRFYVTSMAKSHYHVFAKNTVTVEMSNRLEVVSFPSRRFAVDLPEGQPQAIRDAVSSESVPAAERDGTMPPQAIITTYALRGAVMHHGATMESGHYVSAFGDDESTPGEVAAPNWFLADDEEVKQLSAAAVEKMTTRNTVCYLALYEAVGSRKVSLDDLEVLAWKIRFPLLAAPPNNATEDVAEVHILETQTSAVTEPDGNEGPIPTTPPLGVASEPEPAPHLDIRTIKRSTSRSCSSEWVADDDGPISI